MSNGTDFGNLSDSEISPTLITRYATKAVTLIYSIEKVLYVLITSMIIFAIIALFDIATINGYIKTFSDDAYDLILLSIAIITIGILIYIIRIIFNTRKKLDKWACMFEKNSLRTALSIGMAGVDNNALLHSIIENVTDVGDSIANFIKDKSNYKSLFFNQTFDEKNSFDILIDVSRVSNNSIETNELKLKLLEYGSIIANISKNSHALDIEDVKLFVDSVLYYIKKTENSVGLAILVGSDFTIDALSFASSFSNNSIGYLILIEKPLPVVSIK